MELFLKEICALVDGDVSIETASDDTEQLVRQGHDIVQVADNAIVKVPLRLGARDPSPG